MPVPKPRTKPGGPGAAERRPSRPPSQGASERGIQDPGRGSHGPQHEPGPGWLVRGCWAPGRTAWLGQRAEPFWSACGSLSSLRLSLTVTWDGCHPHEQGLKPAHSGGRQEGLWPGQRAPFLEGRLRPSRPWSPGPPLHPPRSPEAVEKGHRASLLPVPQVVDETLGEGLDLVHEGPVGLQPQGHTLRRVQHKEQVHGAVWPKTEERGLRAFAQFPESLLGLPSPPAQRLQHRARAWRGSPGKRPQDVVPHPSVGRWGGGGVRDLKPLLCPEGSQNPSEPPPKGRASLAWDWTNETSREGFSLDSEPAAAGLSLERRPCVWTHCQVRGQTDSRLDGVHGALRQPRTSSPLPGSPSRAACCPSLLRMLTL